MTSLNGTSLEDRPTSTPKTGLLVNEDIESIPQHTRKKKRLSSQELLESPDLTDTEYNIVSLIEERFKNLEKLNKLDALDTLLAEVADLKSMVTAFKTETDELQNTVSVMKSEIIDIQRENSQLKEMVLDLQTRSMRDNLIFSGIQEGNDENTEETLKSFMETELKIPKETIAEITFVRVHRIGKKRSYANVVRAGGKAMDPPSSREVNSHQSPPNTDPPKALGPRPIVARFDHSRQRDYIKGLGRRLQGKPFGINEHFPPTILERRRVLLPIFRKNRENGRWVSLVADKLYIDNQLFKDPNITPWLFNSKIK